MNRSPWRQFVFLWALLFSAWPALSAEIRIGIQAHREPDRSVRNWQPMADYLSARLPNQHFVIVPMDIAEMIQAVKDKQVDFVVANPALYVDLQVNYGAIRTATLVNNAEGWASERFGSVIFTRADRDDIRRLSDLKGKSFAAVDEQSLGGWLLARYELAQIGITPDSFRALHFSGASQDKIVQAVLQGGVDAGTVRTSILEMMASESLIDLRDVRILGPRKIEGYPFLLSTALYPEYAFTRLRHTNGDLARLVTAQLLLMPPETLDRRTLGVKGWTTPLDYEPVHRLLQDIKGRPYEHYGELSLVEAIRLHWVPSLIGVALLLAVTIAAVVASYLAARLRALSHGLEKKVEERTQALGASEMRLRVLIEAIPDLVWLKDPHGAYLSCNPACARFFGAKEADVIGKTDYDLLERPLAEAFRANDRAAIEAGGPRVNHEWITFAEGGRRALVETINTPVTGVNGKLLGVLGIARDITDLKKHEAEISSQLDELRRWHETTLGREIRIIDLKREVNKLLQGAGLPPRYAETTAESLAS